MWYACIVVSSVRVEVMQTGQLHIELKSENIIDGIRSILQHNAMASCVSACYQK